MRSAPRGVIPSDIKDRHRKAVRIARDPDSQVGKNRRTRARELSAVDGVDDGLFPIYRHRADAAAASEPGHRDPSHRFRLNKSLNFSMLRMTESLV